MKNFENLSREEQKKMIAGDIDPVYCFEGEGPVEGGCGAGYICSGGKCVCPSVAEIHTPVSACGELLLNPLLVRSFIV